MHCSDAPVMNYSAAIKQISDSLPAPENAAAQLLALCNRAYCYQQLGLHRKAIKVGQHVLDAGAQSTMAAGRGQACDELLVCSAMQDYDQALSLDGSSVVALLRKGKALWALNKPKVALDAAEHRHEASSIAHCQTPCCCEAGGSQPVAASLLDSDFCSGSGPDCRGTCPASGARADWQQEQRRFLAHCQTERLCSQQRSRQPS